MDEFVGGEDGASSYGKGNVKDEFRVESLMTATVLHRGLISGYPAYGRRCHERRLTMPGLLKDIAADFALLRLGVPR